MAKNINNNQKWVSSLLVFIIIIAISIFAPWEDAYQKAGLKTDSNIDNYPLSVHFIDVGQGDCIFIKIGDNTMLIDSGEKNNDEKIIKYLRNNGVDRVDYIIATHPHSDHIGAMETIIESFEIKNVIMPRLSEQNMPTTKGYENFLIAVKNSGANVIAATPFNEYEFGDANFAILSPSNQSKNLNNMSVVIKLSFGDTSFLFTGDAESQVEQELISSGYDIRSNVLKMGHHGSNTSNTERFLQAVNPSFSVISCGKDNSYGHPHEEVVELLNKYDINYKRTDKNGIIVVGSDGSNLTYITERELA
ncbi:MAG: MBL fold metallo-hydrolase [Clostridiales bacterium]|nr:MBL fold metallo-hydrolase [Clostridiales bacterium]